MALVSGGGPGTPNPSGGTIPFADAGYVLEQYTYDPYGSIVAAENFDLDGTGKSLHAVNRVGHQGLFFERFDGSYIDQTLAEGGLPSQLATARATGLYYNRNRFYHPQLGRFMTRDPNRTGLPIVAAAAMNGQAVTSVFSEFDGRGLYGDGMHLFQYAGSNPQNNCDASGLELDDFTEAMLDYYGERAASAQATRAMFSHVVDVGKFIGEAALCFVPGGYEAMILLDLARGRITLAEAISNIFGPICIGPTPLYLDGRQGPYDMAGGRLNALARLTSQWAAMAAKYRRLAANGERIAKTFLAGAKNTYAYWGIKNGKRVYVGISYDVDVRKYGHGDRFDRLELMAKNALTRGQALCIELAEKLRHPEYQNDANPISELRPYFSEAAAWGERWLQEHGI